MECLHEIIIGVHSTGECRNSGSRVAIIIEVGVIIGGGGGEGVERLKDKVFDLRTVLIEVIFEMEEDVEWGYYCALRASSVRLLVLLLGIGCFMIVGEGGGGGG